MKKEIVAAFFDQLAKEWDVRQPRDDKKLNFILDCAQVKEDSRILDVASGTGILIPYYKQRNVKKITAVDVSSEMIKIAQSKYADERTEFINADIEETVLGQKYDCCIVYNAFPHFSEPKRLIEHLADCLAENGVLTIAHGLSRERLNNHHAAKAAGVSKSLMSEYELAELFKPYFNVTIIISDEEKYVVSGQKKEIEDEL